MGAAPSIITIPSTSISRDVEALKALTSSRFHLEKPPASSSSGSPDHETMAIMTDKNIPLTIILVAIPVPAANRITSNRVTFVLPESDLRSVVNRCEDLRLLTSKTPQQATQATEPQPIIENKSEPVSMAEFNLPGGAGVALVAPTLVKGGAARYELGKKLAESMTRSLPKGVARTASNRGLIIGRAVAPMTPSRSTPERRQSFGSGRPSSPLLDVTDGRVGPPSGGRMHHTNTMGSPHCYPHQTTPPCRSASPSKRKQQQQQQQQQELLMDLPSFPTLKFNSLHMHGKYKQDFFPNARIPIPVETELFVGHMIFLLRPGPDVAEDKFWNERIFADKKLKRRLVLQVQGKFKYDPKGLLYAGFEASNELRLGRMSKGLSGLLLKWAREKNPSLYYSFGASSEKEKAKAVVPAHTFFDNIIVTSQRRCPPSILEPFKERPESIEFRSKCTQKPWTDEPLLVDFQDENQWEWNINDTYSMSWSTSNIDLPTWKLLSVPGLGDLGLRALLGNSVVRFVMYENLTPEDKGNFHLTSYLRYAYAVQCKYLDAHQNALPKPGEEETVSDKDETILDWIKRQPGTQLQPEEKQDDNLGAEKENGEDEDVQSNDTMGLRQSESNKFPTIDPEKIVPEDVIYQNGNGDAERPSQHDGRPTYSSVAFDSLASMDALCPAWIEMCATQGKYTRAYAFNVNERTVFRTPQSFRDLIRVGNYLGNEVSESDMDQLCSPRASQPERTRRLFGRMLALSLTGTNADSLVRMMEFYSSKFLTRRVTSFPEKRPSPFETGGLVARALSDRHWIEEWVQVDEKLICFQHPESKKRHFEIKMECLVGIRNLPKEQAPVFHNYHFIAVETLGQTTYIMLATETDRARCFEAISKAWGHIRSSKDFETSNSPHNLCLNSYQSELARKSSIWNCGDRLIMNTRQMAFRAPNPDEEFDALYVVEDALRKAYDTNVEQDDTKLRHFLDSSSRLKIVNANSLREDHRAAFFLNLYHVMIMHATLILGVTDSQPSLVKNFGCLSYQCSDDIFSISELEHCILKATMTRLDPIVSSTNPKAPPAINSRLLRQTSPFRTIPPLSFKFPTPKSKFCFALQKPDFRLNFAINFGSPSNPAEIPTYSADTIWEQLEEATRLYLHNNVAIKQRNKHHVCVLPRLCQWYAGDFGSTNYAVLKSLQPYLNHQERKILESREFSNYPITIKYLPFRFECRKLELKEEPFTTTASSFTAESQFETTSIASSSGSSSGASSVVSTRTPPLTLSDAPTMTETDNDVESLLDFLMDDALQI